METSCSETLSIISIISDAHLGGAMRNSLEPVLSEGIVLHSFSGTNTCEEFLQRLNQDERENCALLLVAYDVTDGFRERLVSLVTTWVPYTRKIVFLTREHVVDAVHLSNLLPFDRFHQLPLNPEDLLRDIEHLIETFLEHKILRRSMFDIRHTYDQMKTQLDAIQDANLRLDKKILELSTLSEIGSELISTYDEEEILRETALTLMGQKGASSIVVFLLNEHDNTLDLRYNRGNVAREEVQDIRFLTFSPLMNCIYHVARAQFLDQIELTEASNREYQLLRPFSFEIVIPLLNRGQRRGIVLLGPKINNNSYSDDDFEFFSILSNQMIFALENAHLYEKLQAKISELEQVNKELLKLDRMKSEFITIASHELRTPLTAVRGYSELLLSGKFGPISVNQQKALEVMNKNVDRLIQISDDVVQLSKIDANRISINLIPSAIEKIVNDIIEDLRPILQSRNQSIHLNIAENCPVVLLDPNLIHQAITELIKNAIRFTPDSGHIAVDVLHVAAESVSKEHLPAHHFGTFVEFKVRDDGIGIPTSEYEHIFERFYEVQHSNYHHSGTYGFKSGGTGLGLAIVKGIIEKHGGRIWVRSWLEEVGRGSEFTFLIPAPSFI